MVCTDCAFAFFQDPFKVSVAIVSFAAAILFFVMLRNAEIGSRRKAALIYAHAFALVFPFVFYAYNSSCLMSSGFFLCRNLTQFFNIFLTTFVGALFVGYLLTPKMLQIGARAIKHESNELEQLLNESSGQSGIGSVKLHIVDDAKPTAYSISRPSKHIFLSVGLTELLTRKETEAVLLHELGHIRHNSSALKFSAFINRLISPFSHFSNLKMDFANEELMADNFASSAQGTEKYLKSAKSKIDSYNKCYYDEG